MERAFCTKNAPKAYSVARAEIPFGPVMRARAALMLQRGLIEAGQTTEEIVVVEGRMR